VAANFFQEDEIRFTMSRVACRRAEETGVAPPVSTLVFCRPPLSTGIAVSFDSTLALLLENRERQVSVV
jgi:hypothetical protein